MSIHIGENNFYEVRKNNFYYVDKTLFIRDFLEEMDSKITLLTRPDKFGKSLNLSMLEYFLSDLHDSNNTKKLFEGLNIRFDKECMKKMNSYSLIHINLSKVNSFNWKEAFSSLIEIVSEEYLKHRDKLSQFLSKEELEYYNKIIEKRFDSEEEYINSLVDLIVFLNRASEKKIVVLIDDYDFFINQSILYGYYDEAMPFFSRWYSNLEGVSNFSNILLVGTFVYREICDEIKNISFNTILSDSYSEYFGFTKIESLFMSKHFNRSLSIMEDLYGGYNFGGTYMYNPWSIIKYCNKSGILEDYWRDTLSNRIFEKILEDFDMKASRFIEKIIIKDIVVDNIEEKISYLDKGDENILSIFLHAGYLTWEESGNGFIIRIPNKEVKDNIKKVLNGIYEMS